MLRTACPCARTRRGRGPDAGNGGWIRMNHRRWRGTVLAGEPVGKSDQIITTTLRERKLRLVAGPDNHRTIGERLEQQLRDGRTDQVARRKAAKQGGPSDFALTVARSGKRPECGELGSRQLRGRVS